MGGLLIIAVMVTLLILALGPSHRRAGNAWRPGFETRNDRDRARLDHDLRVLATSDPVERLRSGRPPVLEHRRSTGTKALGGSPKAA